MSNLFIFTNGGVFFYRPKPAEEQDNISNKGLEQKRLTYDSVQGKIVLSVPVLEFHALVCYYLKCQPHAKKEKTQQKTRYFIDIVLDCQQVFLFF